MIYRDDVERVHETCVALERELATYRSFGDVPSIAAAAETTRTRREVRSLALVFVWLLVGVAASLLVALQASARIAPSTLLFWAATFVLVHALFQTRALRHRLLRRARTLGFEVDELSRALTARVVGLPDRPALESSIAALQTSLARKEPFLVTLRRRHVWTDRLFAALVSATALSSALFLLGIHLAMSGVVGGSLTCFLVGMLGALGCGVSAGVVWLKANEAEEAHHALLDSVTLERRRLSLRVSERQLVVSGEDRSATPLPDPTPAS